ncbi:MAG TPA: SufD family Fe-S cluster assembly protein [Thiobacillus sp.]|nr:SufD family Fe-S cluster assembly protein [Thiobacillus sp.]
MSTPADNELREVGYDPSIEHAGSFLLEDRTITEAVPHTEAVEVLPLADAMERYPWVRERYFFHLIDKEQDAYTREAAATGPSGFFIRVLAGEKVLLPVQSCFLLRTPGLRQVVHNLVVAEAGAELHLVNGCTTARYTDIGTHIGVTEYYVGENARVTSSMIHHWGAEVEVYPRTAAHVEKGGHFVSNYIAMSRVGRIQMYPTAIVESGAAATFNSVVYAPAGSSLDLGARVILRGTNAAADIISRAVSDGGYVMNRGHIIGEAAGSRGRMECNGLLLDPRGVIHAIPELEGRSPDIALSHEASVGMISREELAYLMASGLTEESARSLIIQGFLEIPLADLPPFLQNTVRALVARARSGEAV